METLWLTLSDLDPCTGPEILPSPSHGHVQLLPVLFLNDKTVMDRDGRDVLFQQVAQDPKGDLAVCVL